MPSLRVVNYVLIGGALAVLQGATAVAAGADSPAASRETPIAAVSDDGQLTGMLEALEAQHPLDGSTQEGADDANGDAQEALNDAGDAKNDAREAQQDANEATAEGGQDSSGSHEHIAGDTGANGGG